MSENDWYYSIRDGESEGPITLSDLKRRILAKELRGDSLVWHESIKNWTQVDSIPSLASLVLVIKTSPPPLPQVSTSAIPPIQISNKKATTVPNGGAERTFSFGRKAGTAKLRSKFSIAYLRTLKPSTLTAIGMVVATLFLPIAMFGLFTISMFSAAAENARREAESQDLGLGMSMHTDEYGMPIIETSQQQSARVAGQGIGAILGGICCPIIPYVIVMIALGSTYLAFRSAGR